MEAPPLLPRPRPLLPPLPRPPVMKDIVRVCSLVVVFLTHGLFFFQFLYFGGDRNQNSLDFVWGVGGGGTFHVETSFVDVAVVIVDLVVVEDDGGGYKGGESGGFVVAP